jgi:hypothetical protein
MLQLTIDGRRQTFTPLQAFCAQRDLPEEFQVAFFEPKDWEGLGSVDGSGKALTEVKRRVVEAIPQTVVLSDLIFQAQTLTELFHQELAVINAQVGLREVEVEFAVAGFADVLQSVAYQLIQLSHTYQADPAQLQSNFDFSAIYQTWLDDSTRLSADTHGYTHQGTEYRVQVIYNAYGRVGLKVQAAREVYYVADMNLACPAASFMRSLCQEVAQALYLALMRSMANL